MLVYVLTKKKGLLREYNRRIWHYFYRNTYRDL